MPLAPTHTLGKGQQRTVTSRKVLMWKQNITKKSERFKSFTFN